LRRELQMPGAGPWEGPWAEPQAAGSCSRRARPLLPQPPQSPPPPPRRSGQIPTRALPNLSPAVQRHGHSHAQLGQPRLRAALPHLHRHQLPRLPQEALAHPRPAGRVAGRQGARARLPGCQAQQRPAAPACAAPAPACQRAQPTGRRLSGERPPPLLPGAQVVPKVSGAFVNAIGSTRPHLRANATTDSKGEFVIGKLYDGEEYLVRGRGLGQGLGGRGALGLLAGSAPAGIAAPASPKPGCWGCS
jgi:hypothetical protein